MRKSLVLAAALAFSGSAFAADLPAKAPPMAAPAYPSWTGWYAGIDGGGVWGTTDPSARDNRTTDGFFAQSNISAVEAGGSQKFDNSGGTIGGQIGYLYQAGPAILGLEAGVNWMGLKGTTTNSALYPVNAPDRFTWNLEGKSDFLFTFLGRVGYNLGAWYPYVTGGLAVAHLKYTANFIDTFYPTNNTFSFSEYKAGYAIGGGAEWRIAPHWLLRGEYLYMNFDSIDGTGTIACTPGVGACAANGANRTTFNFSAKFKENLGRVAVSYQW
jgi:outer membrane immunogenic protein